MSSMKERELPALPDEADADHDAHDAGQHGAPGKRSGQGQLALGAPCP